MHQEEKRFENEQEREDFITKEKQEQEGEATSSAMPRASLVDENDLSNYALLDDKNCEGGSRVEIEDDDLA